MGLLDTKEVIYQEFHHYTLLAQVLVEARLYRLYLRTQIKHEKDIVHTAINSLVPEPGIRQAQKGACELPRVTIGFCGSGINRLHPPTSRRAKQPFSQHAAHHPLDSCSGVRLHKLRNVNPYSST